MKIKPLLLIFIGLVFLTGVIYASNTGRIIPSPSSPGQEENLPVHKYFSDRIAKIIGQTHEGYNAQIIIRQFPGVVESDFHNVQGVDGKYEYSNNKLMFKTDSSKPQKSDSETITDYDRLLTNIANRLNISVENNQDIDKLIDQISK